MQNAHLQWLLCIDTYILIYKQQTIQNAVFSSYDFVLFCYIVFLLQLQTTTQASNWIVSGQVSYIYSTWRAGKYYVQSFVVVSDCVYI